MNADSDAVSAHRESTKARWHNELPGTKLSEVVVVRTQR